MKRFVYGAFRPADGKLALNINTAAGDRVRRMMLACIDNCRESMSGPVSLDFGLMRIRFKLGSKGMILPDYAGGVFRGGFGLALKRVSPSAYACLFADEPSWNGNTRDQRHFVPYMLVPPAMGQRTIAAGDLFELELRLFGEAVAHHRACCKALIRLGGFGVGRKRDNYSMLAAAAVRPGEEVSWGRVDQAANHGKAADWFVRSIGGSIESISLELLTPLRLKDRGHLMREPPAFFALWLRLYKRACLAARGDLLGAHEKNTMDLAARKIELDDACVSWFDWTRYSARQQVSMTFGGLVGSLQYRGELDRFLPWLRLGEALGVGGKTSFGLGVYRIA